MQLDDRAGKTLGQENHHDAAAHRAGTDDADLLHVAQLDVPGQAVDLRSLALGEEDVALGRRLAAHHQLHELLAFEGEPFVRSEEPTSELQSLMRISYAFFCWTTK